METKKYLGEVWKPIRGYVGLYEVSNYGRVKSLSKYVKYKDGRERYFEGRILKQMSWDKYKSIELSKDGISKKYKVHRLVAIAFIPNPDNLPYVNHKDENPANNYIHINDDGTVDPDKSNLEWCTHKYNMNYGTRNKRISVNEMNNEVKSESVLQFTLNGVLIKEYPSIAEANRVTDISNISKVCQGKRKSAGGFIWRYKDAS